MQLSAASLSRCNTRRPTTTTVSATHLYVSVHGRQVQRCVSSTRSHVYIHRYGALLGEGQQLGEQLGFALLGRPVEAGEAGHKVPLGHQAGLHGEQGLQAFPQAVRGAQHPLVLQWVQGHRGAVLVGGRGEDRCRVPVAPHRVPQTRTAVDQRPPDLQGEECMNETRMRYTLYITLVCVTTFNTLVDVKMAFRNVFLLLTSGKLDYITVCDKSPSYIRQKTAAVESHFMNIASHHKPSNSISLTNTVLLFMLPAAKTRGICLFSYEQLCVIQVLEHHSFECDQEHNMVKKV